MKKFFTKVTQIIVVIVLFLMVALPADAKNIRTNVKLTSRKILPANELNSIALVNATLNNLSSVQYTVTFMDPVSGLSASNFTAIATSGNITGQSVTNVSGSNPYTVTVNTGSGDGTLRLDLTSTIGLSPGIINAPYTSGPAYTIDKTAPTVSISAPSVTYANSSAAISYTVTFTDANMNISSLSNFTALTVFEHAPVTGSATINSISVPSSYTHSGNNYAFSVTFNDMTGDGTLSFTVPAGTVSDNAGNTSTASSPSVAVIIDNTPPTVTIGPPSTTLISTGSVSYDVSFSDANFNNTTFNNNNVIVNPTGTANYTQVTTVQNSPTDFTVSVNGVSGDGTLGISVQPGTSTDVTGNADLGAGPSTTFTVDNTPPSVNSITATTPGNTSPTNASSVSYTVNFSEAVTGVDASDFTATTSGLTTSGITVTPVSSSVYTVAVNGVSGNGTLRLDLNSSGTGIADAVGNPIAGGFTGGDTYTIDQTPPVITSVQLPGNGTYGVGGALQFVVTFNEPVTVNTAGGTPYIGVTLNTGGTVQAAYTSGSTSQQLTFTYTVVPGNADPDGIAVDNAITFNGATVSDIAGNLASSELTGLGTTSGILVDGILPTVNSITLADGNPTNATTVDYTVTFNKPVSGVSTGVFSVTTTGTATGAVNSVTAVSSSVYTVNVNSISGNGTIRLDLSAPGTIFDFNSNQLASSYNTGQTYTIDNTPATLTTGSYYSNNANASQYAKVGDQVTLSVGYSETLQSAIMTIGGNNVPVSFSNGNKNFTGVYTLTSGDTEGNVPWTLSATDLAGNVRNYSNTDFGTTLIFDKTPPAISISAPSQAAASSANTVNYTVNYSDANFNYSTLSTSDITLNTTNTANATVSSVSGSGSQYTVSISNITGAGTIGFTIGAGTGQDIPGNLALASSPSPTFTIISAATATDATLSSIVLNPYETLKTTSVTATETDYTTTVSPTTTSVTVTPKASGKYQVITVNGSVVASGTASAPVTLNTDGTPTVIITMVTAPDGSTIKSYVVAVTQAPLHVASLSSIVLNPRSTLKSVSSTATETDYTTTAPVGTTSVTVTPTASGPGQTITVDGSLVVSGTASGSIPLNADFSPTVITTVVTAPDGTTTNTYVTTVNQVPLNVAGLSSIVLNPRSTLKSVSSTPTETDYTTTAPVGTTSVTVTPKASGPGQTITVDGSPVVSGTASGSIPLNADFSPTVITTVVTAPDGTTTNTYVITVSQVPLNVASLTSIALTPHSTLKVITSTATETDYTTTTPLGTTSVTVTPKASGDGQTITVDGAPVVSDMASGSIALNSDLSPTVITTVVTAPDGTTTNTYVITINQVTPPGSPLDAVNSIAPGAPVSDVAINDGIVVHQALSPNGDGINDVLTIDGLQKYSSNQLFIMNSNGEAVFSAQNYDNVNRVFDGHSNKGVMQAPGTYFYVLQYKDGSTTKSKTGFIVLKY